MCSGRPGVSQALFAVRQAPEKAPESARDAPEWSKAPGGRTRTILCISDAREIESLRETGRELKDILVCTKDFPGWERFSDLLPHGDFVPEHHDKIEKIAFCTDSNIGMLLQTVGSAFTEAEVERFDCDEKDEAEKWLLA